MSMFRRMLLIAALSGGSNTLIVIDFTDGVITLNEEGKGKYTTISDSEVILSE